MMKLKVRAWDDEAKAFWYSDSDNGQEHCSFVIPNEGNPYFLYGVYRPEQVDGIVIDMVEDEQFEVTPYLLSLSIGRFDKNGKEIYKGDILFYQFEDVPHEAVEWDIDSACWKTSINGLTGNDLYNNAEIIGNIYETPELINQ